MDSNQSGVVGGIVLGVFQGSLTHLGAFRRLRGQKYIKARPILGHILTFPDPPLPKTYNDHQYNTQVTARYHCYTFPIIWFLIERIIWSKNCFLHRNLCTSRLSCKQLCCMFPEIIGTSIMRLVVRLVARIILSFVEQLCMQGIPYDILSTLQSLNIKEWPNPKYVTTRTF